MRGWFPTAKITGWKFEAGDTKESALAAGIAQIQNCDTDVCVVNGPSYGEGFGVLDSSRHCDHLADSVTLCEYLTKSVIS